MSNAGDMAFPVPPEHSPNNSIQLGLTKREYIAAMAMQGMASDPVYTEAPYEKGIAMHAVKMADALLAALEKQP